MKNLLDWFSAIGTLLAVIVALWFGLFGNKETRLIILEKKYLFKIESLEFLKELYKIMNFPAVTTDVLNFNNFSHFFD